MDDGFDLKPTGADKMRVFIQHSSHSRLLRSHVYKPITTLISKFLLYVFKQFTFRFKSRSIFHIFSYSSFFFVGGWGWSGSEILVLSILMIFQA